MSDVSESFQEDAARKAAARERGEGNSGTGQGNAVAASSAAVMEESIAASAAPVTAEPVAAQGSKQSIPLQVKLLMAQICLELAVVAPVGLYKLVAWAPYVGERHLSPFIFSWLTLIGFVAVGVHTIRLVLRRSPKGFAFCQLWLLVHVAFAAIGMGIGITLHLAQGESPFFYELMAGMGAVVVLFALWGKHFKQSAGLRRFFGQPPLPPVAA